MNKIVVVTSMLLTASLCGTAKAEKLDVAEALKSWTGEYTVGECGKDFWYLKKGDAVTASVTLQDQKTKKGEIVYNFRVTNPANEPLKQVEISYDIPESGRDSQSSRMKRGDFGCRNSSYKLKFDGNKIEVRTKSTFVLMCLAPAAFEKTLDTAEYFEEGRLVVTRADSKKKYENADDSRCELIRSE